MENADSLILHFSFSIAPSMCLEWKTANYVLQFPIAPNALISRMSTIRPPTL